MINIFLRIVREYKFYLLIFLFYEAKYFLLNYSGWEFSVSNNKNNTDNIPTPFYFLEKIFYFLKKKKIKSIIDLGCGNGRVCFFFKKKDPSISVTGLENIKKIYKKSKKKLHKKKIKILLSDLNKFRFEKRYDVYFLNDPLQNKKKYEKLIKKIIRSINKPSYIVTVNINYKINSLKFYKPVYSKSIKVKNFKIYKIFKTC